MPRRRGDQPVDQAGGFDLVAPAERLDDALNVAPALACVLDEVEVLIGSDLLDADEHGAAPCLRQGHHDSSPLLKINKPSQSQKYRSFSTTMRAVSSQPQHFCDPQRPHHPKPRKLGQDCFRNISRRAAAGPAFRHSGSVMAPRSWPKRRVRDGSGGCAGFIGRERAPSARRGIPTHDHHPICRSEHPARQARAVPDQCPQDATLGRRRCRAESQHSRLRLEAEPRRSPLARGEGRPRSDRRW